MNQVTGYHTQAVERVWVDAKAGLKRVRYPSPYIQALLDEIVWRKIQARSTENLLNLFLTEVKKYYMDDSDSDSNAN